MVSQLQQALEAKQAALRLLTIPQACERSQMGRSFIYNEIKEGRLRTVKIGRAARLVESEFNAWLAELIAQ